MNEQRLEGIGQIGVQGIEHSTVNISQYIGKSLDYQQLNDHLEELKEFLSLLPENNIEKRLSLGKKIAEQEKLIIEFKADVVRLAETFGNIEMYSEDMQKAKRYFDEGKFREADAMLNVGGLQQEQDKLLKDRKKLDEHLRNNANAFLVKAQATALDYNNPGRIALACKYFEYSLAADSNRDNLVAYVKFLRQHSRFSTALPYAIQAVELSRKIGEVALAYCLYDLGDIYSNRDQPDEAIKAWTESLNLIKLLHQKYPEKFMEHLMIASGNLVIITVKNKGWKEAEQAYRDHIAVLEEAEAAQPYTYQTHLANFHYGLAFCRAKQLPWAQAKPEMYAVLDEIKESAHFNPEFFSKLMVSVLSDIASFHLENKEFDDAGRVCRECLDEYKLRSAKNTEAELPGVGAAHSLYGQVFYDSGHFDEALREYELAEQIFAGLAKTEPDIFMDDYARALSKTASAYTRKQDYPMAEKKYGESLDAWTVLTGKSTNYLYDAGNAVYNCGHALLMQNKKDEALTYFDRAIEIYAQPGAYNAGKTELALADSHYNAVLCLQEKKAWDLMTQHLQASAKLRRPFAEAQPEEQLLNFVKAVYYLAFIYTHYTPDHEKAITYCNEITGKMKKHPLPGNIALQELEKEIEKLLNIWKERNEKKEPKDK